jgi:hypothetical protein
LKDLQFLLVYSQFKKILNPRTSCKSLFKLKVLVRINLRLEKAQPINHKRKKMKLVMEVMALLTI